jgi:hypothetical protein
VLSPVLDWEKCDKNPEGLTPNVVFVEGTRHPLPSLWFGRTPWCSSPLHLAGWKKLAEDSFLVWYQGCDSRIGIFHLSVQV